MNGQALANGLGRRKGRGNSGNAIGSVAGSAIGQMGQLMANENFRNQFAKANPELLERFKLMFGPKTQPGAPVFDRSFTPAGVQSMPVAPPPVVQATPMTPLL